MNKKIIIKNEESNDIIGLSIIEFVMMKKESKISVLFYGGKGNGFIGLKNYKINIKFILNKKNF